MALGDWSEQENAAIVADYFSMLSSELSNSDYSKAAHRRTLMAVIDRSEGSIEFKYQNISAVLLGLGHPWILGYKPASNFQAALVDEVVRHLRTHPGWLHTGRRDDATLSSVREKPPLWIGPPPTHSNMPPALDLTKVTALAAKFNVAERDARDRKLGRDGEMRVLENEQMALKSAGRSDLAEQVRWVADIDGDGAGYDILSFEPDGATRLIEVKTTNGWERTPFHLTSNELTVANKNQGSWQLIRLWNFAREPRAYALRPPLENHVTLTPTSFLGVLR